jgi:DNA-binding PadR family transcriptional regulator
MALTEAQKRYQNSDKGRAARRKYMEKKKALKGQKTEAKANVETPKEEGEQNA